MIKLKPLPLTIREALAEEDPARLVMLVWDDLDPVTQQNKLNNDPEMLYYIQYCRSVIDTVDEWRVKRAVDVIKEWRGKHEL